MKSDTKSSITLPPKELQLVIALQATLGAKTKVEVVRRGLRLLEETTDPLNETGHPSTWILPCTTRLVGENILRVPLPRGIAGNRQACEVMIDQSRAIDTRRFVRALKPLPRTILREVEEKLRRLAEL